MQRLIVWLCVALILSGCATTYTKVPGTGEKKSMMVCEPGKECEQRLVTIEDEKAKYRLVGPCNDMTNNVCIAEFFFGKIGGFLVDEKKRQQAQRFMSNTISEIQSRQEDIDRRAAASMLGLIYAPACGTVGEQCWILNKRCLWKLSEAERTAGERVCIAPNIDLQDKEEEVITEDWRCGKLDDDEQRRKCYQSKAGIQ